MTTLDLMNEAGLAAGYENGVHTGFANANGTDNHAGNHL